MAKVPVFFWFYHSGQTRNTSWYLPRFILSKQPSRVLTIAVLLKLPPPEVGHKDVTASSEDGDADLADAKDGDPDDDPADDDDDDDDDDGGGGDDGGDDGYGGYGDGDCDGDGADKDLAKTRQQHTPIP